MTFSFLGPIYFSFYIKWEMTPETKTLKTQNNLQFSIL